MIIGDDWHTLAPLGMLQVCKLLYASYMSGLPLVHQQVPLSKVWNHQGWNQKEQLLCQLGTSHAARVSDCLAFSQQILGLLTVATCRGALHTVTVTVKQKVVTTYLLSGWSSCHDLA